MPPASDHPSVGSIDGQSFRATIDSETVREEEAASKGPSDDKSVRFDGSINVSNNHATKGGRQIISIGNNCNKGMGSMDLAELMQLAGLRDTGSGSGWSKIDRSVDSETKADARFTNTYSQDGYQDELEGLPTDSPSHIAGHPHQSIGITNNRSQGFQYIGVGSDLNIEKIMQMARSPRDPAGSMNGGPRQETSLGKATPESEADPRSFTKAEKEEAEGSDNKRRARIVVRNNTVEKGGTQVFRVSGLQFHSSS